MKEAKKNLQDWFRTIAWSHLLTIEPSPSKPFSNYEVLQTFRFIDFRLNKHFLKSSFSKWDPYDRFFMVAFAEGDGISHQKHFHLLMYSPVNADLQQQQFRKGSVGQLLQLEWMKHDISPLDIRALNQTEAPAVYASKTLRSDKQKLDDIRLDETYWWAFVTPPNSKISSKPSNELSRC